MSAKLATLVVCPGRGTYGAAELGTLARWHADKRDLIAGFDAARAAKGRPTISELDGADKFSPSVHLKGDNAAPLIFAAGLADYLSIDRERHEIVAITGNSMGWYTALACAGAVSADHGFAIADAMGVNSQRHGPGGQLLLTLVDDQWHEPAGLRAATLAKVAEIGARDGYALHLSILLGGMLLVAGDEAGIAAMLAEAPTGPGRAPMRLAGHGPFHSDLMIDSSLAAKAQLPADWFAGPDVPMIDGRGAIWWPGATDSDALWRYTFEDQILAPYDFTRALTVAIREFVPDRILLVGPGETMGGAIGQILVSLGWTGIAARSDFSTRQEGDPLLVPMGRPGQRDLAVR